MSQRFRVMPPSTRSRSSGGMAREHVGGLVRGRLERGAHEMRARRAARDAVTRPRASATPVRRAEPGERRHEVDAAVVVDESASASLSAASSIRPRPSRSHCIAAPVTKTAPSSARRGGSPSSRAAAVRSRPCGAAASVSTRTNEPVPNVAFASPGAQPAEERSLLVAGDAADRERRAEQLALAEDVARRADLRQQLARDVEEIEQLVVPVERVERAEQRARRVRLVGRVHAPAGELPDEPRVDGAEGEPVARHGRRAATRASSPRSTDRGRAPCARGGAPPAARRSARPSAGPATRSRCAPAARSRAPRAASSRAGS